MRTILRVSRTSLVTPVTGVTLYQSVSIEKSPQQLREVSVLSQGVVWRVATPFEVEVVKGMTDAKERQNVAASKVKSVIFMLKKVLIILKRVFFRDDLLSSGVPRHGIIFLHILIRGRGSSSKLAFHLITIPAFLLSADPGHTSKLRGKFYRAS